MKYDKLNKKINKIREYLLNRGWGVEITGDLETEDKYIFIEAIRDGETMEVKLGSGGGIIKATVRNCKYLEGFNPETNEIEYSRKDVSRTKIFRTLFS